MFITSPQTGGLEAALRTARPGDTLVLTPGTYAGDVGIVTQPGLTITSPGPGAVLRADGRHAEGKAILVVRAPGVRIENLEFRGARVPAGNGAGIRFESGSLVLDRCCFVDNEMGVLTAGRPDMTLAVYHGHFGDAPRHDSGMLHHLLYVGAIGHCVVMHSRFGGGWRGHLLKSRARVNRILFNEFDDGEAGGASYEVEFPNGGDAMVLGNLIAQSPSSDNPAMLSMGAEGGGAGPQRLLLRGNHFVDRRAHSADAPSRFVQLWPERLAGPLEVLAEGNRFDGAGQIGLPE